MLTTLITKFYMHFIKNFWNSFFFLFLFFFSWILVVYKCNEYSWWIQSKLYEEWYNKQGHDVKCTDNSFLILSDELHMWAIYYKYVHLLREATIYCLDFVQFLSHHFCSLLKRNDYNSMTTLFCTIEKSMELGIKNKLSICNASIIYNILVHVYHL